MSVPAIAAWSRSTPLPAAKAWESPVCDGATTGITGAPHVGKGKVFIGYNGSDIGVRGSLVAFDATTGKEAWRFWTVPGDPAKGFESKALEMAAKTWSGDKWWEVGGGDVWDPITYDPASGLVIFGTAGAEPEVLFGDKADKKVGGDRLFAGCVIAVNADTGEYVWHFQTSAPGLSHREHAHPVLADVVLNGQKRRVAITAPKNGFIYVLDATNRVAAGSQADRQDELGHVDRSEDWAAGGNTGARERPSAL